MNHSYEQLKERFQKLAKISHAVTFLQWDQLVMMPPGGNESRSAAIAELSTLYHELLTTEEIADLLDEAASETVNDDLTRSLHEMRREHRQATCIPTDLVKAKSLAGSKCEHGWRQQRKDNDWASFLINFQEVVNLSRQEAEARQAADPGKHESPYDALLDLYCSGDSSEFISSVFTELREKLPPLLEAITDRQPPDPVISPGPFPVDHQRELNLKLMSRLGFNFDEGRLDESSHPFSTGDRGDHRITTRFREDEFLAALQATAHETGHACYEAGLPAKWDGLPIGTSRNMCIHESQSLLFEKHLFLSPPFLSSFTKAIHDHLPATTRYTAEDIRAACSYVQPSLIRVEADEVTYPLHVILRFECESALINGTLEAADLPEAWDEKMKSYLGLSTAGNFRDGCLQDIHWTDGSFGYFPSYTMGALNSAQLFAAVKRAFPQWQERISSGDIGFLHEWLHDNIWAKASSLYSQEIIERATGEQTNPKWFLDHIRERYLN